MPRRSNSCWAIQPAISTPIASSRPYQRTSKRPNWKTNGSLGLGIEASRNTGGEPSNRARRGRPAQVRGVAWRMAAIEAHELQKRFGGSGRMSRTAPVDAVRGISFTVERGRAGRLHRPERRRQVDVDQDADRHPLPDGRHGPGARAGAVAVAASAGPADRDAVRTALPAVAAARPAGDARPARPDLRPARRPRPGAGATSWPSSSTPARCTTGR